jgi:hypothetical protein
MGCGHVSQEKTSMAHSFRAGGAKTLRLLFLF